MPQSARRLRPSTVQKRASFRDISWKTSTASCQRPALERPSMAERQSDAVQDSSCSLASGSSAEYGCLEHGQNIHGTHVGNSVGSRVTSRSGVGFGIWAIAKEVLTLSLMFLRMKYLLTLPFTCFRSSSNSKCHGSQGSFQAYAPLSWSAKGLEPECGRTACRTVRVQAVTLKSQAPSPKPENEVPHPPLWPYAAKL